MSPTRYREEVFNVTLAELLIARGILSDPEQILKKGTSGKALPDVLITFRGLRLAIEGKVDDAPSAKDVALGQADDRVVKGIAHIGIVILGTLILFAVIA